MKTYIGPYRVEQRLEGAGMGVVWKAFDEALNRPVVLKTLKAAGAENRRRLEREAQAQARLHDEKVVTVYGFLEAEGELYIVMEYVDGRTLGQMLRARPRPAMPLAEAMEIFGQVLDALAFVHGHGVVHRDVKPSNVMISGGGVKLMDFGIALMADIPNQTKTRSGTPHYMSPEQFESATVDHRSDIYSAAIVLFQMLSGELPFKEKEWLAAAHERRLPAPNLETLVGDLPAGVCEAVAIALRREPEERFETVARFKTALLEGMSGFLPAAPGRGQDEITTVRLPVAPVPQPEPQSPEPESSPTTFLWIVSLALVILTMVASFALLQHSAPPRVPIAPPTKTTTLQRETVVVPPSAGPAPAPPPVTTTTSAPPPPEKPYPFRSEQPIVAKEDDDAERRRQLEQLRVEINTAFMRADAFLAAEKFDAVQQELDSIAAAVQRFPNDLWQEADEMRRVTNRLNDARVAARKRALEEAMWDEKLMQIQRRIDSNHLPEAENLAEDLIKDPHAPERVVSRARELLQDAKERFRQVFKEAPMGETKNVIRKPSSPPRN